MMKRIYLLLLILLLTSAYAYSSFRVLWVNAPDICIQGRTIAPGDTLASMTRLSDLKGRQVIKVLDLEDGRTKVITGHEYVKSKASSIGEFIHRTKTLSTRGEMGDIVSLRNYLTDDFCLLDTIAIHTTFPTDSQRFFFISYTYDGENINKRIENENGTFIITPSIFTIDGQSITPFDARLSVFYHNGPKNEISLITDAMDILIIPKRQ